MADVIEDLGDGKMGFKAGDKAFRVGPLEVARAAGKASGDGYDSLDAVVALVKKDCGVDIGLGQADALLAASLRQLEDIRGKRSAARTSQPSTDSMS